MKDIREHTVLITGAGGNFGLFLCEYFAEKCEQVIALDVNGEALTKIQDRNVIKVECDLMDPLKIGEVLKKINEKYKVSVLINNAGFIHSEPLLNLLMKDSGIHSFENWKKTIDLNLTTCFNISSQVAYQMVSGRTKGVIINISSISAQGNIGQTAYSAAKAGVEAMTKTWAKELGAFKVRAVCIAPGFIETDSTNASLSEPVIERITKMIPLRKMGSLNSIAQAIEMVIVNDYINGKIIPVDGGLTI